MTSTETKPNAIRPAARTGTRQKHRSQREPKKKPLAILLRASSAHSSLFVALYSWYSRLLGFSPFGRFFHLFLFYLSLFPFLPPSRLSLTLVSISSRSNPRLSLTFTFLFSFFFFLIFCFSHYFLPIVPHPPPLPAKDRRDF